MPFGPQEVETMSQALSPSVARCYGLARVARAWKISRDSVYRSLKESRRTQAPAALVRSVHVRTRIWQPTSAGTSPPPAFTERATASYGRDCALRAFAQAP